MTNTSAALKRHLLAPAVLMLSMLLSGNVLAQEMATPAQDNNAIEPGDMVVSLKEIVKFNWGFQAATQGAGTLNQGDFGFFLPMMLSDNGVLFLDIREMATGSADTGIKVTNSQEVDFQQVACGIEAVSDTWNVNVYALAPIDDTEYSARTLDNLEAGPFSHARSGMGGYELHEHRRENFSSSVGSISEGTYSQQAVYLFYTRQRNVFAKLFCMVWSE